MRGFFYTCAAAPRERHRVVDAAERHRDEVEQVVLAQVPRRLLPLLGQIARGTRDVARRQVEEWPRAGGFGVVRRNGDVVAALVHQVEETADVARRQIGAQRPRRVRVSDAPGEVRNAAQHEALVDEEIARLDVSSVDVERHAADGLNAEPRCGDDDVGRDLLARFEPKAVLGEGLDLVGHDRRFAGPDRLEQIAVRDEAKALIPWVVTRLKMGVDVVVLRQERS